MGEQLDQNKELMIVVIKESRHLDDILAGFVDIGIKGATVVDSQGMGQLLSADVPIFAGLKGVLPGGTLGSHLIFSVLDQDQVEVAIELINKVCGGFREKGLGFLFTLPVLRVHGA